MTPKEIIDQLTSNGFTPESVVEAVHAGDVTKLLHSGKVSVQLQRPEDN